MRTDNRVLAVDDDVTNLAIIRELLADRCDLRTVMDGNTALEVARQFRPRVVLLDIMMPGMDGYEVCRRLREDPLARHCRVILVSAKTDVNDRLQGYQAGADDYLTKPFVDDELEAKVNVALKTKSIDEFAIVSGQIERMCGLHCQSLAVISQLRDVENGAHLVNVRGISHILAAELRQGPCAAQIDGEYLDRLYVASVLHDVGKIVVPDNILRKLSDWTEDEWRQMKEHTIAGERILNHLGQQHSNVEVYHTSAAVARWHHECFDGSGYPDGIRGQRIPLAARIVKVADVFDTTIRNLTRDDLSDLIKVRDEILEAQGSRFDPMIVEALLKTFDEITELYTDDMFAETLELTA
jgi:putative two-component system response regulator